MLQRVQLHFFHTGYITVDEQHGRKLYYYFATSENDPRGDAVVLWCEGFHLAYEEA